MIQVNQRLSKPPVTIPKRESGNRNARNVWKRAILQLFPALPNQPLIRE